MFKISFLSGVHCFLVYRCFGYILKISLLLWYTLYILQYTLGRLCVVFRLNLANFVIFFFLLSWLLTRITWSLSWRWNKDSTAYRYSCTNKLIQGILGCEHAAYHMFCRSSLKPILSLVYDMLLWHISGIFDTLLASRSLSTIYIYIYMFRLGDHVGSCFFNTQNYFLLGVTTFKYF